MQQLDQLHVLSAKKTITTSQIVKRALVAFYVRNSTIARGHPTTLLTQAVAKSSDQPSRKQIRLFLEREEIKGQQQNIIEESLND